MGKHRTRDRVLIGLGIVLGAVGAPASGQKPPRITLHLPAQTLDAALRQIGRQAGREIMYPADIVEGKRANALDGVMTVEDAVRSLLRGSGLAAEYREDAILIRRRTADAPRGSDGPGPSSGSGSATVVVTGTRIRGSTPVEPVHIVTAREASDQGLTDLGQVARSLPLNFNGGQNPGVVGSDQGGSENVNSSTTLNLRGLGADATLTLVNGHRVAYDTANQGVDISAIPLLAVDRLEVVAAGSSALYGSDAVAGVANVILRRDYDGVLTTARIGTTFKGGDQEDQFGILAGQRWSDGGLMAALDYNHSTAIHADQRSQTRSLDPSATLLPGQEQASGVVAGHQRISDSLDVTLDAQLNRRTLSVALPFFAPGDVRDAGNLSQRRVTAWTVAPGFAVQLGGGWRLTVGGTHGESTTKAHLQTYFDGEQVASSSIRYANRLSGIEASVEGPLLTLPGGDARLALGGGVRRLALDSNILARFGGVSHTTLAQSTRRSVQFAFAETTLPLVSPTTGIPLMSRLTVNAAVRYEHYQDKGGLATPKAGLRYDPIAGLSLRASWGKSFKAPTLFQEGQATQGVLLPADYFVPAAPSAGPVLLLAGGGNTLKAEKATTWTAGVVLGREDSDAPSLEVNYFRVDYRDRVLAPITDDTGTFGSDGYAGLIALSPTAAQVNLVTASLPEGVNNQTGEAFDPAGVAAIIDNRLANVARQRARGVDVDGRYPIRLASGGRVLLTAALTYLASDQQRAAGQPSIRRAGTIFDSPHWRSRASVTWAQGSLELTGTGSYIGGTTDDRFEPVTRVGSFTSIDLSARLARLAARGPLNGVELTLSLDDITGTQPDPIRTTSPAETPYDSTNYPITGRRISFGVAKRW